jgi:hypothetical protein
MEQDIVIRSAQPAEMPSAAAAYQWLFVSPGQRPSHSDKTKAIRARHQVSSSDCSDVLIADVDGDPVALSSTDLV